MIHSDNFYPFFGVVEDNTDKLGRLKVRCYGYHTDKKQFIPTDLLRWFPCVVSNSAGVSGKGESPTGYVNGSTVFGYFLSGELQDGVVIGSITGKPTHKAMTNLGFNDPAGVYPLYINESDVNRLARNENIDQTIVKKKKDGLRKKVETSTGDTWNEPVTPYNAVYPKNNVHESESGHVHEIDDTEGSERLHTYHKSGSFREIHPDGKEVIKIVSDQYTIIAGDGYFCIEGNATGFVGGNNDLVIKGTNTIDVEGKCTVRAPQIQLGEDSAVEQSVLGKQLENYFNSVLKPYLDQHQHIDSLGNLTTPPTIPHELNQTSHGGSAWSKNNTNQ